MPSELVSVAGGSGSGTCELISSDFPEEPFLSPPVRVDCETGVRRRVVILLSVVPGEVYREPVAMELYSAFIRASSETSSESTSEGGAVGIGCHAYPPDVLFGTRETDVDDGSGGAVAVAAVWLTLEANFMERLLLVDAGGIRMGTAEFSVSATWRP